MVKTTRAQRVALYSKWEQALDSYVSNIKYGYRPAETPYFHYKDFRKTVQPTIGCDNAIAVPWCGMWLCIETDGYTHYGDSRSYNFNRVTNYSEGGASPLTLTNGAIQ